MDRLKRCACGFWRCPGMGRTEPLLCSREGRNVVCRAVAGGVVRMRVGRRVQRQIGNECEVVETRSVMVVMEDC